jgi:hypothetical protein
VQNRGMQKKVSSEFRNRSRQTVIFLQAKSAIYHIFPDNKMLF